jgi:3'(2'), 5'-bisphosphate nucleotidase
MEGDHFKREIEVSVELARKAALATEAIRRSGIRSVTKKDESPLTQADIVSQAIILSGLQREFPQDRILAEEEIRQGELEALRNEASSVLEGMGLRDAQKRLESWVNYRGPHGGSRVWMVDPIDGTKGYRKGLTYAIALGLYYDGRPQFGCIAAPAFPWREGSSHETVIAYGGTGAGAFRIIADQGRPERIRVSDGTELARFRVVGSRAHDQGDMCGRLMRRAGMSTLIRMDGQAKYVMLACGLADVYIRGSNPRFGIGYPWDHCAGQVILEEAGGTVTTFSGDPIPYGEGEDLRILDLDGLIASNGKRHDEILAMVRAISGEDRCSQPIAHGKKSERMRNGNE